MTIRDVNGRAVGPRLQAHMDALTPGVQVQIRLTEECGFECLECGHWFHLHVKRGSVGTIKSVGQIAPKILCNPPYDGCGQEVEHVATHDCAVELDQYGGGSGQGGWFCAEELTIINAKGGNDESD